MPNSDHIVFFDTTLRDGEQSPGCTMHHGEKLRMAHPPLPAGRGFA